MTFSFWVPLVVLGCCLLYMARSFDKSINALNAQVADLQHQLGLARQEMAASIDHLEDQIANLKRMNS